MVKKYLTDHPSQTIDDTLKELAGDKVLVITDNNVDRHVMPFLQDSKALQSSHKIVIPSGEDGKTLETVTKIWDKLEEIGATRSSVVVNIGGGVVTDIGGFAASAFKRGIRTINFPTTLLGAVDAATGGKTGFNYKGLKNEIGAFHMPYKVIVSALPFATLPQEEILSGYAEMIKTALISDRDFYIQLSDIDHILNNSRLLGESVDKCVSIKDEVVAQDPNEKGLRKVLNFGHTAGHAFESLRIKKGRAVSHGKAVAHGMLVALILSHLKLGLNSKEIAYYVDFLKNNYGAPLIVCEDIEAVMEKMNSDKKNKKYGEPAFTLLKEIGEPEINCLPSQEEIKEALEMYIDMAG